MEDPRFFNTRYQGPAVLETPKLIRSITLDRCSNFTSGGANGNDINLLSQLYKARTNSGEFEAAMIATSSQRILIHDQRNTFRC